MKKLLIIPAFIAAFAVPGAAELKDAGAARSALRSDKAKDRLEAIYYLGAQRNAEAYEALAGQFKAEKDAYLRTQIVEALDVKGSSWAFSCAVAAAEDSNKAVRQAASAALARRAGDPAADARLKALAGDSAEEVRLAVVSSMAVEPSTTSASIIGAVLADRKGTLKARRAAAEALAGMKTPAGDTELLKHVSDADPKIKAAAQSRRPSKAKQAVKKK